MIKARGLTKRYGDRLAVDQLTFTVEPGRITGFLGPNGAGSVPAMPLLGPRICARESCGGYPVTVSVDGGPVSAEPG
jgi:ABC-type uncharacterized transport system ATPase subunit